MEINDFAWWPAAATAGDHRPRTTIAAATTTTGLPDICERSALILTAQLVHKTGHDGAADCFWFCGGDQTEKVNRSKGHPRSGTGPGRKSNTAGRNAPRYAVAHVRFRRTCGQRPEARTPVTGLEEKVAGTLLSSKM